MRANRAGAITPAAPALATMRPTDMALHRAEGDDMPRPFGGNKTQFPQGAPIVGAAHRPRRSDEDTKPHQTRSTPQPSRKVPCIPSHVPKGTGRPSKASSTKEVNIPWSEGGPEGPRSRPPRTKRRGPKSLRSGSTSHGAKGDRATRGSGVQAR